ncbi:MAG: radical SAM protein, partial [Anaerolineales bacterium]|nr:radical SAM protein [Anaerolineales bacterium]
IVEFETATGQRILINARREATSIFVDQKLTLNYDREGRLYSAWIDGRNYRRSLDNRVLEKQEGPRPGLSYRVRRELGPYEARQFLADAYARVGAYRTALNDPATRVVSQSPDDAQIARDALARVLACDLAQLERDRAIFNIIYKPINILPPDQYLALVLQATEGCSHNQCAFCGFYRDRKFHVKSADEFKKHIRDVRAFFGGGICLRKMIFLADANALIIPQAQLLPLFDAINTEFAIHPIHCEGDALKDWESARPIHFEGIYSFIDAFTTHRKTARDFTELAARGLKRVYVGLETGDAELLRFLGKPNAPEDVIRLVGDVKAGGVAVAVIVLVGAGGEKYAAQHVRHTVNLINALPLDQNDLIYFSELVDYPHSEYSALAHEANIRPLTIGEIEHQMTLMRAGFRFANFDRAPKVSYYDIREFIY